MPRFGTQSKKKRDECHPDLIEVLDEAIKHYDFSVIDGHRDMERQNTYFNEGVSLVRWPNSKHNLYPSHAFDVIPYPDGFDAPNSEFDRMATYILSASSKLGIRLEWGGHWKTIQDYAHFELKE